MKTKKIFYAMLMLPLLAFWGCSDESGNDPIIKSERGEETQITLSLATGKKDTRAYPQTKADTQTPETAEAVIDGTVRIYVYDNAGQLEYYDENLELVDTGTPNLKESKNRIKITTGDKYFYVFANPTAGNMKATSTRKEFERQIQTATFLSGTNDLPSFAETNFFMGTLWSPNAVTVAKNQGDNKNIVSLEIGRLVAKVKLWKVEKGSKSVREGVFDEEKYRIGSVATDMYLVGQFTGTMPPGAYTTVTSAVHSEPAVISGSQNPKFVNYPEFVNVTPLPTGTENMTNHFYVTENTTALDQMDQQYYGNTTYLQIETHYHPAANEIWKPDLSEKLGGSAAHDGTFYTIVKDGNLYITIQTPTVTPDDPKLLKEYTGGLNYHLLPIRDNSQTDDVNLNSVLRNSYYEINISDIRDLGDNTKTVDPNLPIPSKTLIDAQIKVVDWSKIVQSEGI